MISVGPARLRQDDARLAIAHHTKAIFIQLSAVTSSVAEVREIMKAGEFERAMPQPPHHPLRLTRSTGSTRPEDAFLPHVESGGNHPHRRYY